MESRARARALGVPSLGRLVRGSMRFGRRAPGASAAGLVPPSLSLFPALSPRSHEAPALLAAYHRGSGTCGRLNPARMPLRATIPSMEARRGGRPPQVRPRPSSSGPTRGRVRPPAPSPNRLSRHRTINRRQRMPLVAKVAMACGLLVLAWICLMIGLGLVGPAVSALARGFGGMIGSMANIVVSPAPTVAGTVSGAPMIDPPDSATVNTATINLTVEVPTAVVGAQGYTCRLYVALPNTEPAIVTETPVGGTATLVLSGIALTKGANTFTATVVGPAGESARSAPVTVTLDLSKPKITIASPKNGTSAKGSTITVTGTTQASSNVRLQNDANGATATAAADDTGFFSAVIAIAAGPNTITITVTDPAGNGNTATLTVSKGSGTLRVTLSSTAYQFTSSKLPTNLTFTAVVVGADGKRVAGATALFTVSVPGLQALVSQPMTTDTSGIAKFSTTIPKGATAGSGLATVLITMPTGTQTATDRAVLTVR
jgi:hypothetical protein